MLCPTRVLFNCRQIVCKLETRVQCNYGCFALHLPIKSDIVFLINCNIWIQKLIFKIQLVYLFVKPSIYLSVFISNFAYRFRALKSNLCSGSNKVCWFPINELCDPLIHNPLDRNCINLDSFQGNIKLLPDPSQSQKPTNIMLTGVDTH